MADPLQLESLPLFPLGTVLYPQGLLPLRIFEVRYLDMIGRCRKAGAPFGVVSLTQGHEVRQAGAPQEAFATVGTLTEIADFESPQPALMMIRARGIQRFRIRAHRQLKHGLWVADIESIDADQPVQVPPDLRGCGDALAKLLQSLEQRAPGEPLPIEKPWHFDDCGWLANRWCELLPMTVADKQRMLELDNPLLRLELVNDVLGRTGIA